MNQLFYIFKGRRISQVFRTFSMMFLLLFTWNIGINYNVYAQTTISTAGSFSNNNGSGTVTFNFENSNSDDVLITEIKGVTGTSGNVAVEFWYHPNPVNGTPGVISTANGWIQVESGSITGVGNTTTTTLQDFFTNLNFIVPANTTYGFAVYAAGQRYYTMSGNETFTDGGCSIHTGTNMSYGGGAPNVTAPTNHPRGWIGSITFELTTPCSGTPSAGTVADFGICPATSFNLTAVGSTVGAGIERKWQESPAGLNTWTDITGSNTSNYLIANGINDDTDYRFIITCTNSNLSDTSDVMEVTINSVVDCYCTPPAPNYSTLYWIDSVRTFGGTTNISNLGTGFSTGGYIDYSGTHEVGTFPGSDFDLQVDSRNGSTSGIKVWIDWNQNGVFEASELVYESTSGTSSNVNTYNANIEVPVNAVVGTTKMRIRNYNTSALDPCAQLTYGETEDYSVVVQSLSDCTDAVAGTASGNKTEVCNDESFTISVTGATGPGNGLTYQWQESPANQNNWTNITGATSTNLTLTGVSGDTDYRMVVNCSFGNLSDTSNVVTVNEKPANTCYCIPDAPSFSTLYWIDDVISTNGVSNFSNLGTGFTAGGYSDYSGTHEVEAVAGASFDLEVKSQNGAVSGIKVWIDWNQNGVFESNELVYQSTSGSSSSLNTYNTTVVVPVTAVLGTTRMRVRNYNSGTSLEPCNSLSYGETEDYAVTVLPMPDCNTVSTPSDWELEVSKDTLCVIDDITLSINPIIASDVSYQFQSSEDGINWTNLGTASNDFSTTVNDLDEDRHFRVQWLCNGVVSGTSDPVLVTVVDPEILSITEGEVCGEGTVSLSATASNGSEVIWYEDAAGTVILHEGNNFTTPNLTSTTTYYVAASLGGGGGSETSLTTITTGGTSCSGGIMFDLTPNYNMNIDSFEARAAGAISTVNVYYKVGTSVGSETSANDWILHESVSVNGTSNQMFMIVLDDPITLAANQVHGIYLNYNASYTNTPNTTYSNADLTLEATYGMCGLFSSPNTPRVFNGTVFYSGSACSSNLEEVVATVHPEFSISIDGPSVGCVGETLTLDAGSGYTSYSWSNNATTQTIDVTSNGTYSVVVEDQNGCLAEDSIEVSFNLTPVVDLGDDIYVCGGVSVALDAGNPGKEYLWSTGDTTQIIQVMQPGVYSVEVSDGPCAAEDSIVIFSQEYANASQITVTHLGGRKFQFGLANPVNIDSYLWNFGDGVTSTDANPIHEFPATGDFLVILKLFNEGCGEGATLVHLIEERPVSIKEMDKNQVKVYPNPAKDYITIELNENNTIENIAIRDITGRTLIQESVYPVAQKYRVATDKLSSGIYYIIIQSAEGTIQRNIEIIK